MATIRAASRCVLCTSLIAIGAIGVSHVGFAQVITDGTVGPSASLAGPDFAIGADLGMRKGGNLYHSFQRFDLDSSQSASFSGPADINNVLARVTGGRASSIDGTIRNTIAGADTYLINPSGIIFGPNAELDVRGAFTATTADEVVFPDGGRYSATHPGDSVLSVAPPEAFGFLGPDTASITIDRTTLQTGGNALSLIGGDVTVRGSETTRAILDTQGADPGEAGGNLRLASTEGGGTVLISPTPQVRPSDTSGSLTIAHTDIDTSGRPSGDTVLVGGTLLFEKSTFLAESFGAGPGGGLVMTGQSIAIRDDPVAFPNFDPETQDVTRSNRPDRPTVIDIFNRGSGEGGGLVVTADEIAVTGAVSIGVENFGDGPGGDLVFDGTYVEIVEAPLATFTWGEGEGGAIRVDADRLVLDGNEDGIRFYAGFASDTRGPGDGGPIEVYAGEVTLRDGGRIGSFVTPLVEEVDGQTVVTVDATGDGGDVTIVAGSLDILGEDAFRTGIDANTEGSGGAGTLKIDATSIFMDGTGVFDLLNLRGLPGRVQIQTSSFPDRGKNGDAGPIKITAESIEMTAWARITAGTFTDGKAGSIDIETEFLQVSDGASIQAVSGGRQDAGNISIAADTVILGPNFPDNVLGGASIAAVTFGPPDIPVETKAGAITIVARSIQMMPGTAIDALTLRPGSGGSVTLIADDISITGLRPVIPSEVFQSPSADQTRITASARAGAAGGTVALAADTVMLSNEATVLTNTAGSGPGGTIRVNAGELYLIGGASLDAGTSESGPGGDILVNAERQVLLSGADSGFFVESSSSAPDAGLAGTILVEAPLLIVRDGAVVSTSSASADGGNIELDPGALFLDAGALETSVGTGFGSGGNIVVDAGAVLLRDGRIEANAFGGPGGNITIDADAFLTFGVNVIEASSAQSTPGTITLNAPETDLSGNVALLAEELLDAAEQLASQCNARRGEALATFVGRGRSGLPQQPGDPLVADYAPFGPVPVTYREAGRVAEAWLHHFCAEG